MARFSRATAGSGYAAAMRFSPPRRAFVPAILTGIAIATGCSSSSPTSKVYIYATLGPSPGMGGACSGYGTMSEFLSIGSAGPVGQDMPTRVSNGGATNISCTVKGGGSSFDIDLSVTSNSLMGGTMELSGSGISPTTGATNLTGSFNGVNTSGAYSATDCILTYSTQVGPGAIAPGRIWAHVDCAIATNGDVMVGSGMPSTCAVAADFIFENCGS
jgi:hypothetical protein